MTYDHVVGTAGLVLAVIGIPVAFLLARRGRQKPDLRNVVDFDVLLRPDDGLVGRGLAMSFGGYPITRVSRTYLALWNARGDTVDGSDVVPGDPLRIQLDEGDGALQAQVVSYSRQQNGIGVEIDPVDRSRVLISFDFLDAGDGAVFEVVHQGTKRGRLTGTVRGAAISYKGGATLTSDALSSVSSKSRLHRIRKLVGLSAILLVPLGVLGIVGLVFVTGLFGLVPRARNQLIDVTQFDLNTVHGQRDFAQQVSRTAGLATSSGEPSTAFIVYFLLILAILWILTFAFTSYRLALAAVPHSVLNEGRVIGGDIDIQSAASADTMDTSAR